MDVYEALYPSRMMWRMRPDPIPLATQARILDAAIRAPNGGNTQRWHFLVVEDQGLKRKFGQLYRRASDLEHDEFLYGRSFRGNSIAAVRVRHSTTTAVPISFLRCGTQCWPPALKGSAAQ
jgi:nitroreductase